VLFELSLLGSTALDDTCGNINENGMEEKYELETEITHTFNNNLRSNVGLGFTKENVTSETFLDSNAESFSSRLRASAEYNHNRMTLNGGIMIEHEPDVLLLYKELFFYRYDSYAPGYRFKNIS